MQKRKMYSAILVVSFLIQTGCGGGNSTGGTMADPVTESVINGYHLVRFTVNDDAGNPDTVTAINYDFDANTNEWTETGSDGNINWREVGQFDDRGRLVSLAFYDNAGGLTYTSQYEFDNGLITKRTRTNGSTVTFSYNDNDQLEQREYTDTATGQVTRTDVFTYNDEFLVSRKNRVNNIYAGSTLESSTETTTLYTHNANRQLILLELFEGQSTDVLSSFEFTYDANGNNIGRVKRDSNGDIERSTVYEFAVSPEPVVNSRLRTFRFFL